MTSSPLEEDNIPQPAHADFPGDIFEALPIDDAPTQEAVLRARRPDFFGIYLTDDQGNEQPFLDFHDATSATYAALRLAQRYRLGVEFGKFTEPKLRVPDGL